MKHFTTPAYWKAYDSLPVNVKRVADANYLLLKDNPLHPSLHFKKINSRLWSVRAGLQYRALATRNESGYIWFWIGSHAEYDRLIS